jgi:hypothetical protein
MELYAIIIGIPVQKWFQMEVERGWTKVSSG